MTFADHEVITPPHDLRRVVRPATEDDDDPVARGEAALAELSSDFADWMRAECDRLEGLRQEIAQTGFTRNMHQALFRAAHDIKGEAATFGYPAVAPVADSLCRLLEHTPQMGRISSQLVAQHVDAVRAIVREHERSDHAAIAAALGRRLRDVTDEFLRSENRDRPDYLAAIFAPLQPY